MHNMFKKLISLCLSFVFTCSISATSFAALASEINDCVEIAVIDESGNINRKNDNSNNVDLLYCNEVNEDKIEDDSNLVG